MNIKRNNEDEGFQAQDQTYQLFESQDIQHPLNFFSKTPEKIRTQSQPPMSWYTTIKNYKTPQFINNCYSVPDGQQIRLSLGEKEEIEIDKNYIRSFSQKEQQSYAQIRNYLSNTNRHLKSQEKNIIYDTKGAWQAQKDQPLQEYFRRGYICIYNRFGGINNQPVAISIVNIPTENIRVLLTKNTEKGHAFVRQIQAFTKDNHLQDMRPPLKDHIHPQNNSAKFYFTSCFQSGNLSKVYQHYPCPELHSCSTLSLSTCKICSQSKSRTQLFLLLSNDTNTLGYNQWFYFKCTNLSTDTQKVLFIICNYTKKILEEIGQTGICCFSKIKYQKQDKGWFSINGSNAGLRFTDNNRLKRFNNTYFRSLQFQYEFQRRQTAYFSLSLPYTFTKLINVIRQLNFEQKIIGMTKIKNPLISLNFQNSKTNKTILILARQHPSQTSGSYVMEGVMRKLSGNSPLSLLLKKKFRVVLIPMCNPDGVIHGNSRTNLSGVDINRKWDDSVLSDKLSSEVYTIIRYMKTLGFAWAQQEVKNIQSQFRLNSFAYFSGSKKFASLFANQMGNLLPCFKFKECTFDKISQPHENTLRGIAGQIFKIDKAVTIQTSIHGWLDSDGKAHLFSPRDLMSIGQTLIDALAHVQFKKISLNPRRVIQQLQSQSVCSDSDPEGDYLPPRQELYRKEMSLLVPRRKLINQRRKLTSFSHHSNFKYQPLKNISSLEPRERLKTDYPCNKIDVKIATPKSIQIINKFEHRYLKTGNLKKLKRTQPILDSLSVISRNPKKVTL